jgi:ribulose-5-phosphate 4-epimerase/fuculose-1-phosphate aldolase
MAASHPSASHPPLEPDSTEPSFATPEELRAHRKRELALAYRVFGAQRWGSLGDGHISARDPERTGHFWLGGYGVPFNHMTVRDLVLVGPDGTVVEGGGGINPAAYNIHWPVHEARPDIVSAAHTHTPYGTPFAALGEKLRPITQESTAFFDDHEIFDDEEVDVVSVDGGCRIGKALGSAKAVVLRNHGLLTVGASIGEAVGWFVLMERCAEAHMKAAGARPISDGGALAAKASTGSPAAGWHAFQWLLRTLVPDPSVVD